LKSVIAATTVTKKTEIMRAFFKKGSLVTTERVVFVKIIRSKTPGTIKSPRLGMSCSSPTGLP